MSREILFRGKRIDNGEWVEGFYFAANGKQVILNSTMQNNELYHNMYEIKPNTVCQFTGLIDKNGRKIWENDILLCGEALRVSWNTFKASWVLSKKGWLYNHFFGESVEPEDVEVIGNAFDNPELLEKKHE